MLSDANPKGQMLGLMSGQITPKDIGLNQQRVQLMNMLNGVGLNGGGTSLGFTPESIALFKATRDPKLLDAIKPVQKVVQTDNGPRIKSLNPLTGQEIADLGPDKSDKITPEQAGRLTAATTAEQNAADVKAAIEKTSGLDRKILLSTMATAFPGTKGRELRFKMMDASDAVVRLRTGATANETELKQILEQFMPSPLDSDEGVQDKMNRFERFIGGAIDAVTIPPSLKRKIEKSRPNKKPSLNMGKPQGDLSNLSNEQLMEIINGK